MMKTMTLVFLLFATATIAIGQSTSEDAAVRSTLEDYMSGDGNRMEKAFHPSATMKYIDAKSNQFTDVPIADFIARVKANTSKMDRKIEIVSMNVEGNAAQAKIRIETDKVIMHDYMNLLKVDGNWKIVSKIFSRQEK
jgi:hypothetical protein